MTTMFPDWSKALPVLGVSGMRLRALREDDGAAWYAYLSQEAVIRHTSWRLDGPGDLAELIRAYAQPDLSHSVRWAIVGPDDQLAGTIGLNEIAPAHRRAEIAYDIAPAFWRQGLASKACAAVSDWALLVQGFARIQATVLDSNAASAAVLDRCRYRREGLLHAYRMVRGEPRHFWMYARIWPPPVVGAECG
ncbi:GNAT family N-acetyltransferase [Achromobacter arsenitoxydans]|uniref:GCN5-related N-acetyltransferase n=1 Tax=Achromobacter arsenitoxydans SY8 TaxID=477184 RepID=H0F464_9BURK|nr:GNAT family protein [Achromobacter arsenitoxydans]EHK66959.1 GCN5-related N-acetyltransferase [Achromobacter arsenitoxydans SY8]